jgi:outer membrane protein TolC
MTSVLALPFASLAQEEVVEGPVAEPAPSPDPGVEGPPKVVRLSLDECISRAVENSRELAAERHRLAAIEAQINQVLWAPFSLFSVAGSFSMVPDRCIDTDILDSEGRVVGCGGDAVGNDDEDWWDESWGPTFRLDVKGTLPLYGFGRWSSAKEALGEAKAAAEANLPSFRHKLRYNVQRAYHGIVGAREMLYTLGEGRKKLVAAREKLERDLESQEGAETEIDLIKIKVFESEVDAMEAQTRQIERVALAALRFLVGGAGKELIDVPEDPQLQLERDLEPLETYQGLALEHRPEVAALRHALRALEAKVELKKAEFWPIIALALGWRWSRTPGRTDVGNWVLSDPYNAGGYMPYFALTMQYDLDWGLDKYALDQARAELSAMTADQQEAVEAILLEVETTYIEVTTARDGLEALDRSRRLTKGWLAAAVQSHAAGLGGSKEVKDALKEHFQIMAQTHRLIGEYNAGLAKLDKVTGVVDGTGNE